MPCLSPVLETRAYITALLILEKHKECRPGESRYDEPPEAYCMLKRFIVFGIIDRLCNTEYHPARNSKAACNCYGQNEEFESCHRNNSLTLYHITSFLCELVSPCASIAFVFVVIYKVMDAFTFSG